ncbi:hypothetical protein B566_EDAN005470 [Ephemera danica]|nr:hypothetical protein B566_EDAN005470 [Ephemera danica]
MHKCLGSVEGPVVANQQHDKTNKYVVYRSYNCGQLRSNDVGRKVTLCGWLQYHRMSGKFIVLRDGYGCTQIIFPDEVVKPDWNLDQLTLESVISIKGTVVLRPGGQANPGMPTGGIEILAEDFVLLNAAKNKLPFTIREFNKAKESLRMKYRYLDIRFPEMQSNLRLRSSLLMAMRNFLATDCGFVEVETPTLFRKTPGGAQEFVVPSRVPGHCYTLVQSPQQFKQLLMVGGIDRYFQIARCYRDESARSDRQPEFTQLDIEMSFSDQKGLMALSEDLISHCWRTLIQPDLPHEPFPVMKYQEAMDLYGTDKPDTRFDMKIQHLTDTLKPLADMCSPVLKAALKEKNRICGAVIIKHGQSVWSSQGSISRQISQQREQLTPRVTPACWIRGIQVPSDINEPWPTVGETAKVMEAIQKHLTPMVQSGDLVWLTAGPKDDALSVLGRLRLLGANELERLTGKAVRSIGPNFLWLVDFPLFYPIENIPTALSPAHHPFTQVHPYDAHMLFTDPLKVRGQHYDLVLDGWEVAGGSVRIHDAQAQRRILEELLQVEPSSLQHMLDALDSGCPPHAGIAFGIDRLLAVACGTASIRDVIAFPKAIGGRDLMSGAPVEMTEADQELYHIRCAPQPTKPV